MDFQVGHLASHDDAEMMALLEALGLEKMASLLAVLQEQLGRWVIWDPDAKIQKGVLMDGILAGRCICDYLLGAAIDKGFDPRTVEDRWSEILQAALARAAVRKGAGQ
jgi:hypothetical protein